MRSASLEGQVFGRLTVIKRAGSLRGVSCWLCKCSCGRERIVTRAHLKQGGTKSCGCYKREKLIENGQRSGIGERSRKHGDFGTKLYSIWAGVKRRCQNPNTKHYSDYGGRGIRLCDDWQDYINFKKWALASGYADGMSIERIDVNSGYCPENCKWIPRRDQALNRRSSIRLEYGNRSFTVKEAAEALGMKERTVMGRVERGWTAEQIFETKLLKNQYGKRR